MSALDHRAAATSSSFSKNSSQSQGQASKGVAFDDSDEEEVGRVQIKQHAHCTSAFLLYTVIRAAYCYLIITTAASEWSQTYITGTVTVPE